jgi:hypothetical protein
LTKAVETIAEMGNLAITYGDQRRYIVKPPTYELFTKHTRAYFKIPAEADLCFTYFPYVGSLKSKNLLPIAYDGLAINTCVYVTVKEGALIPPTDMKLRIYCRLELPPKLKSRADTNLDLFRRWSLRV